MNEKAKGYLYGIIAAVSYGTNPLGALFLYRDGFNAYSVLFYRYLFAVLMISCIMLFKRQSFKVSGRELSILGMLGVLFAISSITLFLSFNHMDAGVASTLLFVYPVMVAVLMALLFKERITAITVAATALALCGVTMLYQGNGTSTLSITGVILVMFSSLTYAVYIITVNKSALQLSSIKLTLFVLVFGLLTITIGSFFNSDTHLQLLTTPAEVAYALILALFPTVISLVCMTKAINAIGSTPAAIMGALEPLTAVLIGVTVFGESFTAHLALGIVLILSGVILIIIGKHLTFRHHISFAKHSR